VQEPPSNDSAGINPSQQKTVKEAWKGQFVLAFDKKLHDEKRISLFMAKVVSTGSTETVHVYRPRTVRKHSVFLPLWYRWTDGEDWEEKTTDKKLSKDWMPWLVELDPERYVVKGRSSEVEGETTPPRRMIDHYKKVWDKKVSESMVLEKCHSPLVQRRIVDSGGASGKPSIPSRRSKRVRFSSD
jgi:hypothetical protein